MRLFRQLVRDPMPAKLAPVHAIRGTMAGKLAGDPPATKIEPAAAARGPVRLGLGPKGKGRQV